MKEFSHRAEDQEEEQTADFFFFGFETVFLCVALAVLELWTHFVDQAGLEHRNPPASASQVLGLKACVTTAQLRRLI